VDIGSLGLGLRVGEEIVGAAGFLSFTQAVGVAADGEHGGFMQEPIQRGAGHDGVAVEVLPIYF
jgi:hypothetical protein